MKRTRRPPRPKKWTMRLVSAVEFLKDDRIERLLDFRQEYREKLKSSRRHADSFARAYALRTLFYASKEALFGVIILGKAVILG
jgi:hypothetical protein